jgi:hypothetical protein
VLAFFCETELLKLKYSGDLLIVDILSGEGGPFLNLFFEFDKNT